MVAACSTFAPSKRAAEKSMDEKAMEPRPTRNWPKIIFEWLREIETGVCSGFDPLEGLCHKFQYGKCHRGRSCRFRHEKVPNYHSLKKFSTTPWSLMMVAAMAVIARMNCWWKPVQPNSRRSSGRTRAKQTAISLTCR